MDDRKIFVIRHGETDWNLEERFQGRLDIPLNAAGRAQALRLAEALRDMRADAIYSSPLRRAYETAEIIAGGRAVISDERLMEIHHGVWQGRSKTEIAAEDPDGWRRWDQDPTLFTIPGGESTDELRHRVSEFLASIQERAVLCVTHGVVIQMISAILLRESFSGLRRRPPANGCIHEFKIG